jgi:hypothetical protein
MAIFSKNKKETRNHKPVQTGSDRFKDFSKRKCHNNLKRKPVQTGSRRFMAFAQKYHKPVQFGSDRFMDFSSRKCRNNVKTWSGSNRFTPIHGFLLKQ